MSKSVAKAAKKAQDIPHHSDEVCGDIALNALLEITPKHTFRIPPRVTRSEGVATVLFDSAEPGYPGWAWTISVSDVAGLAPTVLELELLPGDKALLSPEWVPWADRMEEYLLHEKELSDAAEAEESADDDDDDDVVDFDDDVDGVDIDQLDLDLDPAPLEVPEEPTDVFDHVEFDEEDPLDP
jgi:hypothetical protein